MHDPISPARLAILQLTLAFLLAAPAVAVEPSRTVRLPDDAGYADVTKPPYNADPTGKTDATAAIQQALSERRRVYLPSGTYLVSDIIHWGQKESEAKRGIVQGENRDRVVIKLKDHAPEYDNPDRPKEIFRCASRDDLYGPANAFRNAIYDLTIDVGRGNPGAIGVFYYAHNQGAMENVRIVSPDPASGLVGLDLYRGLSGPALVKNLSVEGFAHGIRVGGSVRHMVFEHVALRGQRAAGVLNESNTVTFRDVTSDNAVPAFENYGTWAFMVVLDAQLRGGAGDRPAIENVNGYLFARNVDTSGYAAAVRSLGQTHPGGRVDEFVSHRPFSLFPSPPTSLNLPVEPTPDVPWDAPDRWASAAADGPDRIDYVGGGKKRTAWDYADSAQKAIDSGATTVYFPPVDPKKPYTFSRPLVVRGNVRRIFGADRTLATHFNDAPLFRIEDGHVDTVVIERVERAYGDNPIGIEVDTARTVVLKNSIVGKVSTTGKGGKFFIEDVSTTGDGLQRFKGPKQILARQYDPEPHELKIVNDGATLWILGLKTEREGTIVQTINHGTTEVLGGLIYATSKPKPEPMFESVDSRVSYVICGSNFNGNPFEIVVRETRDGQTRELKVDEAFVRDGWGSVLPLYRGYGGDNAPPPSLPDTSSGGLITDLVVHDQQKASKDSSRLKGGRFQVHRNLQPGEVYLANRQFILHDVPPQLRGAEFIRVNTEVYKDKQSTDVVVQFRVTQDAIVYATEHFGGWDPTGVKLGWIYSYNVPPREPLYADVARKSDRLYRKSVRAGETVAVGAGSSIFCVQPVEQAGE